jgi:GYF domain 2
VNSFENNQSEAWIVRVEGKEYGPVDVDELREWKREGRLIRENEIREPGSEHWIKAGELVEIFGDEVEAAEATPPPVVERRSFGEILAEGWRIYRAGFGRFFLLALLVSAPSFFLQLAAPYLEMPKEGGPTPLVIGSALVVFVMLALLVVAWPFSLAGMQLLAADLSAGRDPGLRDVLTRAKPLWMRMFILGLIVYGSYFLWTVIPLLVALSLAAGPGSPSSIGLMLLLLFFTVYMVARLFINFLFWQQAGVLGGGETIDRLRESKELARSGTQLPRMQRPLYRGALIASLWLLVIIFFNFAIEMPVVLYRMRGVTSLEQAAALLQTMATESAPDFLSGLTTFLSSLVHAILRPWLAAVFVVLYLATKAAQQKRD